MQPHIRFSRRLFCVAGIYGLLVITPLFVSGARFVRDCPPAINHPEYSHGFASGGFAWQVLFLLLAIDPLRSRLIPWRAA